MTMDQLFHVTFTDAEIRAMIAELLQSRVSRQILRGETMVEASCTPDGAMRELLHRHNLAAISIAQCAAAGPLGMSAVAYRLVQSDDLTRGATNGEQR